jgi:hypothetical protein
MNITQALLLLLVIVVSAIPLNLAVKLMGGKSSILRVILANIIVGILAIFIDMKLGHFAGIVSFIAMLFIYKHLFHVGYLRALLAWVLQFVIILIFILALAAIGVTLLVL